MVEQNDSGYETGEGDEMIPILIIAVTFGPLALSTLLAKSRWGREAGINTGR